MKAKFLVILLGISLVLTGCTTGVNPEQYLNGTRDSMLTQGKPPAYVEGYLDGCSTGRRLAGDKKFSFRKNNIRYDRDSLYARGWQDGQVHCRNEALAENQDKEKERNEKRGIYTTSLEEEKRRRIDAESGSSDTEVRQIWEELKK